MRHLPLVPTLYPKMLVTCPNEKNRVNPHCKEIPSEEQRIDTDKDTQIIWLQAMTQKNASFDI